MNLQAELEKLKAEISSLKKEKAPADETSAKPSGSASREGFEKELGELKQLVSSMLDDAEHAVAEHPVAAVAGALALGIIIGRITAN